MQLWNQAHLQLIEVRLCTVEVAMDFSMPTSGFIYAADHIQYVEFGDVRYTEPADIVLHGGSGTPVKIVPRFNRGRFYLVTYHAEWGRNTDSRWRRLAEQSHFGERVSTVHAGAETSLRMLLHTMEEIWQQRQPGAQLQAKAYFLSFLYEWIKMQHQQSERTDSSPIAQVIQYMQHFYAQPITLKQLAERASYSVPHLCALFREATGYTAIEFLTRLRVEAAKTLLTDSTLGLPEVAEKVGYRDPSYFGRVFKRIVGLSPLHYKHAGQNKPSLAPGPATEVSEFNPLTIKRSLLRNIEHALGEAEITAIPQRIIALDWTMAEYLLALGIIPLGVSEACDMHRWVGLPMTIPDGIEDIGPRIQPDLQRIAELSPDLIIGIRSLTAPHYDALQQIAPTVAYDLFPPRKQTSEYESLEFSFRHLASVLDRGTLAAGIQYRLEDSYKEMREHIRTSRIVTSKVMIAFGYSRHQNSLLRLSNDGSLSVGVLERLGLTNAFKPGHYEPYGFTTAHIDEIEIEDNALMMYVVQRDDKIALSRLLKERNWRMLNVSSHRRSLMIPSGMIWPYGGPLSVNRLAVAATRSLTLQSSRYR
ncbi:iron-siderophore ABC transporter substrate-binding protein [Cohnella terricola]|uniref:iron-siderophore ABC transporter substrate-binding protein n=1 Tax=Cohnella terricola TaxID=1289167 RepID=UPI001648FE20|nr:iron-siderophore ABC transporter substrate-binding protein [Cohnella terricola]